MGHELHGEAAIAVAPSLDVISAHAIARAAELVLRDAIERLVQVTVHVEPAAVAAAVAV